jgi:spermidine/putrescine transport system ATP-binding protein
VASTADPHRPLDLDIRAVSKRYGAFAAVDDLSFQVRRGSFFSILGPSGCGKTTLLRMVAGFVEPDAGDIVIKGESMHGVPPNQRPVNMVFQHLALFPMMSVGENIAYGLQRRGVKAAIAKARVTDMLQRVGLPGSEGKRIDQLSGGQKQRVAIARSLVLEPTLLLLRRVRERLWTFSSPSPTSIWDTYICMYVYIYIYIDIHLSSGCCC